MNEALQMKSNKTETIVTLYRLKSPFMGIHCLGWVYIHPGRMARIGCKVPADFTQPVALFEANYSDLKLQQLDISDGLVDVHHSRHPYVEIPVCNYTQFYGAGQHPVSEKGSRDKTDRQHRG